MLKNTSNQFGTLTKCLHWSVFVLLILQYYLVLAPNFFENFSPVFFHKSIGVILLILGLCFVAWRMNNIRPTLPENIWKTRLAMAMHHCLLTLLIVIPVLGYCMSCSAGRPVNFFGLFTLPCLFAKNELMNNFFFQCHQKLAFLFLGLIFLHALAAFHHHFILKDNILKRMLPFNTKKNV